MTISLIVAVGNNRVIGNKGTLPWKMPSDMKHFKELTLGKPVIMGRRTYESIGRPLKERKNIILTRDKNFKAEGCFVVHSREEAIKSAEEAGEIMVIGGAEIYQEFLPIANRIYLTQIHADFEGDAYFPEFDKSKWQEVSREDFKADDKNPFDYSFIILEKF